MSTERSVEELRTEVAEGKIERRRYACRHTNTSRVISSLSRGHHHVDRALGRRTEADDHPRAGGRRAASLQWYREQFGIAQKFSAEGQKRNDARFHDNAVKQYERAATGQRYLRADRVGDPRASARTNAVVVRGNCGEQDARGLRRGCDGWWLAPEAIGPTTISADWRDVCTSVIIAAGMVTHESCVNGQAKAAAGYCGHCPSAPSAGKRCINPRSDGNPRKPISPRESFDRFLTNHRLWQIDLDAYGQAGEA